MSTRSATIIRQTTYWGEYADTEEIMRFYRHCDGYPEGHGVDLASSVMMVDQYKCRPESWLQRVLADFLNLNVEVEFEPNGFQHGDLEYLYVLDGIVDHRWGKTESGKLPITISVYGIGWDENYADAEKREPIFSGTAYEYVERFGKGQ